MNAQCAGQSEWNWYFSGEHFSLDHGRCGAGARHRKSGYQEIHPRSDARRALVAADAGARCAAVAPVQPGRAWRGLLATRLIATGCRVWSRRATACLPKARTFPDRESPRRAVRRDFLRSISSCRRRKSRAKINNPVGVLARRRRESGRSRRHYGRRQLARNGHCQTA